MGYQHRMAQLRSEGTGGGLPDSFDRSFVRLRPFREYLESGVALIGTGDEVRPWTGRPISTPPAHQRVMLLMALPGLDTDSALESMHLFAERVAPTLRRSDRGASTAP
jgi:hypothetical protein